jgi:hypothetical protein
MRSPWATPLEWEHQVTCVAICCITSHPHGLDVATSEENGTLKSILLQVVPLLHPPMMIHSSLAGRTHDVTEPSFF